MPAERDDSRNDAESEVQEQAVAIGESIANLVQLSPDVIRPNPENPRMFFRGETILRLAESIEQEGVLVPITVYAAPDKETATTHVLLDGERRWQAATQINHPQIPALVVDKPEGIDNTLLMFNIHMQREEWTEIATAWALEKVMERLDTRDVNRLRDETGLSANRIRNMLIVLRFPRDYQEAIVRDDNPIPFNFFVELDKAVLRHARRSEDGLFGRDSAELTDLFLQKYESRVLGDVVDLRKVGELIAVTDREGYVGEQAREALSDLISNPERSVLEAYSAGAAASSEIDTIVRDARNLPGRVAQLLTMELAADQKQQLQQTLKRLRMEIDGFLGDLEH